MELDAGLLVYGCVGFIFTLCVLALIGVAVLSDKRHAREEQQQKER